MSTFSGYARTNLFKVKDIDSFCKSLSSLSLPVSDLYHEELVGFIWTGDGQPFQGIELSKLAETLSPHLEEPIVIIIAGAERGNMPVFEAIHIETDGTLRVDTLKEVLGKRADLNFDDAPVVWAA